MTVHYQVHLTPQERRVIIDLLVDYLNKFQAIKSTYAEVRASIGEFAEDKVSEVSLAVAYEALYNEQDTLRWLGVSRLGELAESLYDGLPVDVKHKLGV